LGVPIAELFEEPADPKASAPSRPEKEAAEGQLARLERYLENIRAIAKGLDPEGSALDRMTAEFIKAKLREIEGDLAAGENALANHLGNILEAEGEEVEGTTVKTTRPESKQS
jgi:hypothetical protein